MGLGVRTRPTNPQLELFKLDRDWCDRQIPRILEAMQGRTFTQDDVHEVITEEPDEPNWHGVLMAKLRCQGLIEKVGYKASQRKAANGRVLSSWRIKERSNETISNGI